MFRLEVSRKCFVIFFSRARAAKRAAAHNHFAFEIDAFAALGASDARAFETRQIFWLHLDLHQWLVTRKGGRAEQLPVQGIQQESSWEPVRVKLSPGRTKDAAGAPR